MAEKKVTEAEASEKKAAPKKTAKTITKVDSAKATTPAEKPAAKTTVKATPATAADKSSAKTKRILAVVFWVLAIVCEVLAVLVFVGKVNLHISTALTQVIGLLVLDFILVVFGAQFWKQANRIDPVSEQNKTKFWLWNNMGVIVCCFAFIPFLIYVLLIDKDADPKMKKVASIVAAVALVLGIGLNYTYSPVSAEGKAQAEATLGNTAVYWTPGGSVYHLDSDCQHLANSTNLFEGNVDNAIEAGKTRLYKTCAKNYDIELAPNGAISSLAAPLTAAVEEAVEEVAEEPAA